MKNILLFGKFATYEELWNTCPISALSDVLLGCWNWGYESHHSQEASLYLLLKNESIAHSLKIMDYVQRDSIWGTLSSQVQGPGSNDSCCGDQCTDKCKLWWAVERSRYKYCWLWPPFHPRHGVARTQLTRPRTSSPPCWLVLSRSYRHRWGVESWPRLGEISHILFVANVHKGL